MRRRPPSEPLGAREGRGGVGVLLPSWRLRARCARRFETARLIGALFLDPFRGESLGRAFCAWTADRVRRRTGAFAAELLLPESGVRSRNLATDAVVKGDSFERILREFDVGAQAAAWQLWNTGLLSSPSLRDELIEEFASIEDEISSS
jgi:hypothetical protein